MDMEQEDASGTTTTTTNNDDDDDDVLNLVIPQSPPQPQSQSQVDFRSSRSANPIGNSSAEGTNAQQVTTTNVSDSSPDLRPRVSSQSPVNVHNDSSPFHPFPQSPYDFLRTALPRSRAYRPRQIANSESGQSGREILTYGNADQLERTSSYHRSRSRSEFDAQPAHRRRTPSIRRYHPERIPTTTTNEIRPPVSSFEFQSASQRRASSIPRHASTTNEGDLPEVRARTLSSGEFSSPPLTLSDTLAQIEFQPTRSTNLRRTASFRRTTDISMSDIHPIRLAGSDEGTREEFVYLPRPHRRRTHRYIHADPNDTVVVPLLNIPPLSLLPTAGATTSNQPPPPPRRDQERRDAYVNRVNRLIWENYNNMYLANGGRDAMDHEDGSDVDDDNDDFTSNVYQSLEDSSNADESDDFRTAKKPQEKQKQENQENKEQQEAVQTQEAPNDVDDCGNDGLTCSICFEPWTSTGKHRLCCLKCGHLFGLECIYRWLKTSSVKQCPQCKTRCKKSDIRNLYATKLIAVDHGELEQVRELLSKEQDMRRNKDMEISRFKMEKSVLDEENKRLQTKIKELTSESTGSGRGSKRHMEMAQSQDEQSEKRNTRDGDIKSRWYTPVKRLTASTTGGCRVLAYDPNMQQFAVSQPCPHSAFINGFGVKRIDAELQSTRFILLHTNQVKDIKFSPHHQNQILSAGQEGSVKITDLSSTSTVVEYRTPRSAWCCCWDQRNENYIYAGLSNNSYMQYDIRNTTEPLATFAPPSQPRCPIISIHHIKSDLEGRKFPGLHNGILSGTLAGAVFWQESNQSDQIPDFTATHCPARPDFGSLSDIQYDDATKHCLATYRPGRGRIFSAHVLYSMSLNESNEISFDLVDVFDGGDSNRSMTRNSIFSKEDKSLVMATIDETQNRVKVFDVTWKRAEKLKVESRPMACMPITFDPNHPNKQFAVLSENALSIYES